MNYKPDIPRELSTYRSAKNLAEDIPDNINIIGIGTNRLVIQDPFNENKVIKLAAGCGIEQNINEIKVWEISKIRGVSHLLLPIEDYTQDKTCIKMHKVSTSFGLNKFQGPKSEEIYIQLNESGIKMREIESAIYHGNPVAFDYGGLKHIQKH